VKLIDAFDLVANGLFIGILHLLTSIFIARALWKSRQQRAALVVNTAHHVPRSTTANITTDTQSTGNNSQLKMSATEKRICMSLLAMNATYFAMVVPSFVTSVMADYEIYSDAITAVFRQLLVVSATLDWIFFYMANTEFRKMLCGRCLRHWQ
jgi:hypothetical protein